MFEHRIYLEAPDVAVALSLVNEVKSNGLLSDQDFVWRYIPGELDTLGIYTVKSRAVEFDFKEAIWATFFRLKWLK